LGSAREQSVFRAVGQFVLTGLLAVLLLGLIAVQVLRSTGTRDAIDDAKRLSRVAGDAVVVPLLTRGVLDGDRRALARLDRAVRRRLLGRSVVRVKVWDPTGRIVYSDEPRLIGSRYPLGADERRVLEHGSQEAEVSDLSRPENRFERRFQKLLEVYGGVRARDGKRVLFESYQPFKGIAASGRRTWLQFLPALVGALLLLELVQIPLAYLLARRLRDRQRERTRLLERALDASAAERRRIAAELHDGPVQELAGVAFGLSAAGGRLNGGDPALRAAIEDAAGRIRATMRNLRSALVDLHPPALRRSGLQPAVSDLLSPLAADGVTAECDIPTDLRLPERSEALLFRTAREALANVRKHAAATTATVTVRREGDRVVLIVADDGRGFDEAAARERAAAGHLGLRLVADLVHEGGGRLDVESAPGRGTTVRVEMPA
jgi:signal transduction histidine kinase